MLSRHWPKIWGYLAPFVMGAFHGIIGVIQIAWALISGIFKIGLDLISGNWSQMWNDMKDMLHGVWDGIVNIFKDGVDAAIGIINLFIGGLNSMGFDVGPVHIHPNIPKIPLLETGGYITGGGLAMLHPGERVVPARVARNSTGPGGVGGHTFNISLVVNNPMRNRQDTINLVDEIERELAQRFRQQTPNYGFGGL